MPRNSTIYQVNSFTSVPFKGNPAGIMILERPMNVNTMQSIASEMNLSETAFVTKNGNEFEIRYFTPINEVPICGHATLAAAHVMYEKGIINTHNTIFFRAKAGILQAKKEDNYIVMQFPVYNIDPIPVPEKFPEIVGFQPMEIYSTMYDWIIAVANDEDDIRLAHPNFESLIYNNLGHLAITAKSNRDNIDFVCRCFAPLSGINEDPVTGSLHSAFTPLWAKKLAKNELTSMQISKRTGILKLRLKNNGIEIKGEAVTIFKAELLI